jgi:hypothetical protein
MAMGTPGDGLAQFCVLGILNRFTEVQEFCVDSFLKAEIPESLKYGTFAGEMRLYIMQAAYSGLSLPTGQ